MADEQPTPTDDASNPIVKGVTMIQVSLQHVILLLATVGTLIASIGAVAVSVADEVVKVQAHLRVNDARIDHTPGAPSPAAVVPK